MSNVQIQGNIRVKAGANTSDQKLIKQMVSEGKSVSAIVKATRINEETVESFVEHFKNGGRIAGAAVVGIANDKTDEGKDKK